MRLEIGKRYVAIVADPDLTRGLPESRVAIFVISSRRELRLLNRIRRRIKVRFEEVA